jgi:hypothetical protein
MTTLRPLAAITDIDTDGKTITVHVPLTFRKRGGRKLVISPAGQEQAPQRRSRMIDDALLHSLVHAFEWKRLLDEGCYATIAELAGARKLDRSFVSRTLRLTLLPPDLVEAILDGRQTDAAQRQVLLHIPSASWNEQIRVLE